MAIKDWSTTAASNNSNPPNGFPENMAPSAVNDSAREVMAQVRGWYEDAEWINLGYTHTYVGATQFKIATDVSAEYHVGRRVRVVAATPVLIYGTITVSSYVNPDTTITVAFDSGTLSNETLTVSLAALSANASAIPGVTISEDDWTIQGDLEVTGSITEATVAIAKTVTTTQGDIITRGASADGRLARGADGAGLYSDGTDVVWGTNSSIQFVEKSDASVVNVTTADVTFDDNPFVITEGQELLSQVFTPLMSSSRLKIRVHAHGYYSTTLLAYMGLFDGNTNAIATTFQVADGTNAAGGHLIIDYVMPAADHTTAAITFTVRAAVSTGGWFINGKASSSRLLGGSSTMSISIEEFGD